jgi:hypothetical protein
MGLKRCPGTILHMHGYPYVEGIEHLSIAALRAMPNNCYVLGHVPSEYDLSGFRVLTILREPRDVLVSYCRHRKRDGFIYDIPQALKDFWGAPFVETYRSFLGWRGRSVMMRYEDMPPSVIGDGKGIYEHHDRDYNTRTGSPSDWRKVWDDGCEQAWINHGGPELLAVVGYA